MLVLNRETLLAHLLPLLFENLGCLGQAGHNGLRLGGAAGHSNVYMNPLFQGAVNGIAALENVAGTGTGTNTDNDTGFGYLCDGTDDSVTRLAGDRAAGGLVRYGDPGVAGGRYCRGKRSLRLLLDVNSFL